MTLLLSQDRNDRQDTLSKLTTCSTLGPKAPLAPEHHGAESLLGGIIREFYILAMYKGPQRWLILEQGAT
jgi:hypothetical protein